MRRSVSGRRENKQDFINASNLEGFCEMTLKSRIAHTTAIFSFFLNKTDI